MPDPELSLFVGASLCNRLNIWWIAWSSERMLSDAKQSPSGQLIIIFHTYCSIIGRSIIHRSILCSFYVLTHLLNVWPGRVAQSVTSLATDACLTAIPGVASSIPARSHTFVEIDHEIISTVILLPSADSFKKGCCQLQAKVCARITGYPLVQACPEKSVVRWTDRPAMTIAVDLGRKATKTNY